mmetsp:Transcript_73858/g.196609  ORF Transcript_73858/g.196609 Transcript_73858/m.196609 type:complete len:202 (+) Transcript_73858:805-1410(+)
MSEPLSMLCSSETNPRRQTLSPPPCQQESQSKTRNIVQPAESLSQPAGSLGTASHRVLAAGCQASASTPSLGPRSPGANALIGTASDGAKSSESESQAAAALTNGGFAGELSSIWTTVSEPFQRLGAALTPSASTNGGVPTGSPSWASNAGVRALLGLGGQQVGLGGRRLVSLTVMECPAPDASTKANVPLRPPPTAPDFC